MLSTTIDGPYTQAHIRNWLNYLIKYQQRYPDCDAEDAFYIVTNNDYMFMSAQWWLHAASYLINRKLSIFLEENLEEAVSAIKNRFSHISDEYILDPGCPLEKLHIPEDIPQAEKELFFGKLIHFIDGTPSPSITPLYHHVAPIPRAPADKSIAPAPNFRPSK